MPLRLAVEMTTPDAVQNLLDADPRLSPEERHALGELFRIAYERFADEKENGLTDGEDAS